MLNCIIKYDIPPTPKPYIKKLQDFNNLNQNRKVYKG